MPNKVTHKRGRKKSKINTPLLISVIAGVLIVALIIVGIVKLTSKDKPAETEETGPELEYTVSVDGVDITGLMESQARSKLMDRYSWNLKASLDGVFGESYEIANLIEPEINSVLSEIYATDTPKENYSIVFIPDAETLNAEITAMQDKWNVAAKNGSISAYDETTETFAFADAQNGFEIDTEQLRKDITDAVSSGDFKKTIKVLGKVVEPEFNQERAKELYKTIGTYQTKSTANPDRNNNLNLACTAINGLIIEPGEEFSFNLTTGNRTLEKGYKAAGAYQNGELVEEPGGGVCQVASTLYNAVIFSGIPVTERHAHTFEPSYVTPGEDSTVSYDGYAGPDLKFTNTTSSAIVILAKYKEQTVTCSIIGIPVLAEGETITMHSVKDESYAPPIAETVYEDDYTIPPHTEVEVQKGDQGSRWTTYITHSMNGEVVSDEVLHTSTYKGHTPKIKRNPSDYQLDEEGNVVASSFEESTEESAPGSTIAPHPGEEVSTSETSETKAQPKPDTEQGPGDEEDEDYEPESPVPYDEDELVPRHPGFE